MSVHVSDLTFIDYKILSFIGRHKAVTMSTLKMKFPLDVVEFRLERLVTKIPLRGNILYSPDGFIQRTYDSDKKTYLDSYYLSTYGEMVLRDNFAKESKERRRRIRQDIHDVINTVIAFAALAVAILAWLSGQ